ncbi:hypothetical protein ABES58_04430 [Paenibacillus lautus]|uniref:hypothetical protein n=1 Tax=Paenibacillus lautus TaxID=1401 RepID=UPI003D287567
MAGKIPDRIIDDAHYDEILKRIEDGAQKMDHPLMTPEKKTQLMPVYDALVDVASAYRRAEMVDLFPEYEKIYADLGLPVQGLESASDVNDTIPEPISPVLVMVPEKEPQEPEQSVKAPPSKDLMDWLDD